MPSPSKTKGKNYENVVAKFLTETYGAPFARVPSSGAFIGGQNFHRRHNMSEGQIRNAKGDIVPPDDWNHFNCEAKFYKEFKFHLLYTNHGLFETWIKEVDATADDGDLNLMFMKFNRIGEYMAYELTEGFKVNSYTVYKGRWGITAHSEFWTDYNKSIVLNRCIAPKK